MRISSLRQIYGVPEKILAYLYEERARLHQNVRTLDQMIEALGPQPTPKRVPKRRTPRLTRPYANQVKPIITDIMRKAPNVGVPLDLLVTRAAYLAKTKLNRRIPKSVFRKGVRNMHYRHLLTLKDGVVRRLENS